MNRGELDRDSLGRFVTDTILATEFRRGTFGGVARTQKDCPWVRVVVRAIQLRGERQIQFAYFDGKKNISKNYSVADTATPLAAVLAAGFSGIHLSTGAEEIDLRVTKKGKVLVGRRYVQAGTDGMPPHNRVKEVALPEGQANRVLEVMGILTHDGRVRPSMRAKFTQVNEFLKQLNHVLDDAGLRHLGRPMEILDCGCGSSFLTLAAHHYLNDTLGVPANLIGVDVNDEVIRKSISRSNRLGVTGLNFTCAGINASAAHPDVVFALHACDTATDEAIAKAIAAKAKLFLGAPCCHHHLNNQLRPAGPAEVLRPMLRHGILHQRMADLVTDAFRALALRIRGYRTEVIEFIGTEHTPRNLMIRATRGAPAGEAAFVDEYRAMKQFWGVTPYIERLLPDLAPGPPAK